MSTPALWTVSEVTDWARNTFQESREVAEGLEREKINGRDLLNLTKKMLQHDIKVKSLGTRRNVMAEIEALKRISGISDNNNTGIDSSVGADYGRNEMLDSSIALSIHDQEVEAVLRSTAHNNNYNNRFTNNVNAVHDYNILDLSNQPEEEFIDAEQYEARQLTYKDRLNEQSAAYSHYDEFARGSYAQVIDTETHTSRSSKISYTTSIDVVESHVRSSEHIVKQRYETNDGASTTFTARVVEINGLTKLKPLYGKSKMLPSPGPVDTRFQTTVWDDYGSRNGECKTNDMVARPRYTHNTDRDASGAWSVVTNDRSNPKTHINREQQERYEQVQRELNMRNLVDGLPVVNCADCDKKDSKGVSMPCGHSYCIPCLRNKVTNFVNNRRTTFLGCCNTPIDETIAIAVLNARQAEDFQVKMIELQTTNQMTCPNCSGFVSLDIFGGDQATFKCHCGTWLCSKCQARVDPSHRCNKKAKNTAGNGDKNTDTMMNMSSDHVTNLEDVPELEGVCESVTCPKCELHQDAVIACNHVMCGRCKLQFCYSCSNAWNLSSRDTCSKCRCEIIDKSRFVGDIIGNSSQALHKQIFTAIIPYDARQQQQDRQDMYCEHKFEKCSGKGVCNGCNQNLTKFVYTCRGGCNGIVCANCNRMN